MHAHDCDTPALDAGETMKAMRERVHRAILTTGAQRGPFPAGFPSQWALGEVIQASRDAYGYTDPKRRFQPTPRDVSDMLPVMAAVARYRHAEGTGRRDFKIILGRAYDQAWWVIAERLGLRVSDRSVRRYHDEAVEEILKTHLTSVAANCSPRAVGGA